MSDKDPFGFDEEDDNEDRESAPPEDPDKIPLDVSDDEFATPEEKDRLAKKKARGKLHDALKQERERADRLEQQMNELRGSVAGIGSYLQQGQRPQVDELEAAIEAAFDAEQELVKQAQAEGLLAQQERREVTPEKKREWEAKHRRLLRHREELTARKVLRDSGVRPAAEVQRNIIQADHADVQANPKALLWADGRYRQLIGEGHADSKETLELAMGETREKFGLQKRPGRTVTSNDKARYAGTGRGAAGSEKEPATITMTNDLRKIAYATYANRPELTDRQKEQLWVKENGKSFLKHERERVRGT